MYIKKINEYYKMSRMVDIVVSVLLGLGISFVFKLCCDSRSCIVYQSPSLYEKIIEYNNKCYTPMEKPELCDANRTRVNVNE
jgi:hypothetical protein